MLAPRHIVRCLAPTVLVLTWSGGALWAADPAGLPPGEETSPLSAYELEKAATALADALRLSRLTGDTSVPVRLRVPEWRNYTGEEFRDAEATVRGLCGQINCRSGAAVAFALEPSFARYVWGQQDLRLYPTRLTLETGGGEGAAELVLEVVDTNEATRTVQIRHPVRLSVPADRPRAGAPRSGTTVWGEPAPRAGEDVRGPAADKPPAVQPATADLEDGRRVQQPRSAITIRKCRLPHPRATPPDEDVERETELDCGRLLFLDRKTAERLVLLSAECQRQNDGTLLVVMELACRRKHREIEVWAEFFDRRGRGVNRTRAQDYSFREGQIRVITLCSGLPAEQVVVFMKKD
ncbi:MAG: hypothetical protein JSU68_05935 [Phycisphaerales bacterium]|nr:MAG: hypothetical protein JSU68_05935 [Phycisphaerales bacterium]